MNSGHVEPVSLGDILQLVTPRGWSPPKFLQTELALATGDDITYTQARRFVAMAKKKNRVPWRYNDVVRSILVAALRFARDELERAESDLRAMDDDEEMARGAQARRLEVDRQDGQLVARLVGRAGESASLGAERCLDRRAVGRAG